MSEQKQITVAKPFLPPLEDYIELVSSIWKGGQLTNDGPLHKLLETQLAQYLNVEHVSLFCNGTIALIAALRQFDFKDGEVITTPFSFAATAHAIEWSGLTPVFVDIDERSFNLDPSKIEGAITERTRAILPVHVFGNSCDTDSLEGICTTHGLKLVFDAAHSFGANCHCGQLLNRGDCSILSFHSTKVFHTVEGGMVVSKSEAAKKHLDLIRNFGIVDETTINAVGLNGKMNEFEAAMGLAILPHMQDQISHRACVDRVYRDGLGELPGIVLPDFAGCITRNYSYFPILVGDEAKLTRDQLYERLALDKIKCRRYFYPLLSNITAYKNNPGAEKSNLPIANRISEQVLCLPISGTLQIDDVRRICTKLQQLLCH